MSERNCLRTIHATAPLTDTEITGVAANPAVMPIPQTVVGSGSNAAAAK